MAAGISSRTRATGAVVDRERSCDALPVLGVSWLVLGVCSSFVEKVDRERGRLTLRVHIGILEPRILLVVEAEVDGCDGPAVVAVA